MVRYVQTLDLDRLSTNLEQLDAIMEAFRQYALPETVEDELSPGRVVAIRLTVEAEDLWDLRDLLEHVEGEFDGYSECFQERWEISRDNVVDE